MTTCGDDEELANDEVICGNDVVVDDFVDDEHVCGDEQNVQQQQQQEQQHWDESTCVETTNLDAREIKMDVFPVCASPNNSMIGSL